VRYGRAKEDMKNGAVTLEADLIAERIAIESYREMITFIGQRDPTTHRLLESILAQEDEHAEDLVDLLEDLPKD
jgi:bacterioferritin